MNVIQIVSSPQFSLLVNALYAVGNCVLGFITHSGWFITVGAYYAVLAINRFSVLLIAKKSKADIKSFAKQTTGFLLLVLSFCLIGINVLSAVKDRGTKFHEIIMIAIATYTFTKITLAIIGLVKAKKAVSPIALTLRNISFADAVVSVYTLQRSMLVSFPGLTANEILLFNILTGTAVWMILLLLGLNLIGGKRIHMAKSKIAAVNKKIAEAATDGYKKIEEGVVKGYTKIEESVVKGYTKIEDKFVAAYLTKDGESIEEAKERIKNGKG